MFYTYSFTNFDNFKLAFTMPGFSFLCLVYWVMPLRASLVGMAYNNVLLEIINNDNKKHAGRMYLSIWHKFTEIRKDLLVFTESCVVCHLHGLTMCY